MTAADFEPLSPLLLFLVELPILRKPREATAPAQGRSSYRPTDRKAAAVSGRHATLARARFRGLPDLEFRSARTAHPNSETAGKHLPTRQAGGVSRPLRFAHSSQPSTSRGPSQSASPSSPVESAERREQGMKRGGKRLTDCIDLKEMPIAFQRKILRFSCVSPKSYQFC